MSVSTTGTTYSYPGPGGTVFPFPFSCALASHLRVYRTDLITGAITGTSLILGTDYTVSGIGGTSSTVTLTVDLGQYGLLIKQVVPLTQDVILGNQDAFYPKTHEAAFDRLSRVDQQQQEQLNRSIKFPANLSTDGELIDQPEEGYVLGWVSGKLRNLSTASAQLAADLLSTATGKGAALISYLAPYTGAVATTQSEINQRSINLFDFLSPTKRTQFTTLGVNPDITTELQTALDEIDIGSTLIIPNGAGTLSGPVYIAKAATIKGSGPHGQSTSYSGSYQIFLADDTSGFRFDPSYVGAGVNPFAQPNVDNYGCNFIGLRISGGKASIPIAAASNQIAIKLTVGVDVTIRNCVFRSCGTAISVNSTYAAKILDNHYINCGYCVRLDPDFAAAGHTTSGATDYYQANILNIERNYISGAKYGIYLFGPSHGINILGNAIEDCTSAGIVVSSYNGSLATASTDLGASNDTTQIRGNYFERNATAIQWGSAAGGLSQAVSAPKGVICTGNFYTFQGVQIYNLSVYAATASEYRHNRFNAYLTATPDVIFQGGAAVTLSHIECSVSWSGSPATDTSTVVRRYTSTYRDWSTFYVDGASASKVTIAALQTYGAGTSGVPFDSLTTLQAWLKSVLRSEKVWAPEVSTVAISVDVKNGTYTEKIGFDGCGLSKIALTPNSGATADGISFTGISANEPYTLIISGGGKIILDNGSGTDANLASLGANVVLSTVKVKMASNNIAGTKGLLAFQSGTFMPTNVTNFDANLPQYGVVATGGRIMKNGTTPSGAAGDPAPTQGGVVR